MSRVKRFEWLFERLKTSRYGIERIPTVKRLVGSPQLLPGESFSSWCFRIRSYFGVSHSALADMFEIQSPFSMVDVGASGFDLDLVASLVVQPPDSLRSLVWPVLSRESLVILGCLTNLPLLQRPVFRYCENCLRDDVEPYFRQFWRFSFAYICPVHVSILRDRCPHCKGCIDSIFRSSIKSFDSLRRCPSCFMYLCDVKSIELPVELTYDVLCLQMQLANLVSPGADFVKYAVGEMREGCYDMVGKDGVVDLSSGSNSRKLFASMLSLVLTPINPDQGLRERFSGFLEFRDFGIHRGVALGLDGWAVFGNKAGVLPLFLYDVQELSSGTFWWSIDHQAELFQLMPGPNEEAIEAAVSWLIGFAEQGDALQETSDS